MFRLFVFIFSILICAECMACGSSVKKEGELPPLNEISDNAMSLLRSRNFKALEKLAIEYRDTNAIASDGLPKLIGFYSGVSKNTSSCGNKNESDENWKKHKKMLIDWSKAMPHSVAPKLALAEFEYSYAWHARGGGYSNTVSDRDWALFKERLENARVLAEKIDPQVRVNEPRWYELMLKIGQGQGWPKPKFEAIYSEAVKKFPYYYPLYFTKANFYSAKWYGSEEEFSAYVDEAVKATQDKLGMSMYARIHWSTWENNMFRNGHTKWGKMKEGFERVTKDFPDSWNRNNYAKFACMAGDGDALNNQLKLIGDRISYKAWDFDEYLPYCKKVAYIYEQQKLGKRCRQNIQTREVECR